jgi:hypothetical protein
MADYIQNGVSLTTRQAERIQALAEKQGTSFRDDPQPHQHRLPFAERGSGVDFARLVTILEFSSLALDTLVRRPHPRMPTACSTSPSNTRKNTMPRDGDIRFDRRPVAVEHESARGEIVRNVGAFTRGSQLIRLRYMMMMEGLRWPILAAVLSFSLLLILLLALLMREHEVQLVEMRIFADLWDLVDLDPGHSVNLTLPDDSIVPMTIGDVPTIPMSPRPGPNSSAA